VGQEDHVVARAGGQPGQGKIGKAAFDGGAAIAHFHNEQAAGRELGVGAAQNKDERNAEARRLAWVCRPGWR